MLARIANITQHYPVVGRRRGRESDRLYLRQPVEGAVSLPILNLRQDTTSNQTKSEKGLEPGSWRNSSGAAGDVDL